MGIGPSTTEATQSPPEQSVANRYQAVYGSSLCDAAVLVPVFWSVWKVIWYQPSQLGAGSAVAAGETVSDAASASVAAAPKRIIEHRLR